MAEKKVIEPSRRDIYEKARKAAVDLLRRMRKSTGTGVGKASNDGVVLGNTKG